VCRAGTHWGRGGRALGEALGDELGLTRRGTRKSTGRGASPELGATLEAGELGATRSSPLGATSGCTSARTWRWTSTTMPGPALGQDLRSTISSTEEARSSTWISLVHQFSAETSSLLQSWLRRLLWHWLQPELQVFRPLAGTEQWSLQDVYLQYWRFQYNVCAFKIGISSIHFVDCPACDGVDFMVDRACWTLIP
jgi:hypothetical protein